MPIAEAPPTVSLRTRGSIGQNYEHKIIVRRAAFPPRVTDIVAHRQPRPVAKRAVAQNGTRDGNRRRPLGNVNRISRFKQHIEFGPGGQDDGIGRHRNSAECRHRPQFLDELFNVREA